MYSIGEMLPWRESTTVFDWKELLNRGVAPSISTPIWNPKILKDNLTHVLGHTIMREVRELAIWLGPSKQRGLGI